jgi:hypothetical protein
MSATTVVCAHFCRAELDRYRQAASGAGMHAFDLYRWNLQVSEAFYPALSCLEISFRNALHSQLSVRYGRDDWWADARLGDHDSAKVQRAINDLCTRQRLSVPCADGIVAELSLGFWVSLLSRRYDRYLTAVLAGLADIAPAITVYDPFCRSGEVPTAFAVRVRDEEPGTVPKFFGMTPDAQSLAFARMNADMHGCEHDFRLVGTDELLSKPPVGDKFSLVLANPPFGMAGLTGNEPNDWPFGPPPLRNANFAWLQRAVERLAALLPLLFSGQVAPPGEA